MSAPVTQDVNRSYELYITMSVCIFALVTTTVFRIAGKLRSGVRLSWDDYTITLGTCLNIVATAFDYKATASGFGRHAKFLAIDQLVEATKYAQLAIILACLAICAVKVSICFFLLGIIKGTHVIFARLIWTLMGFTILTTFLSMLLWGLQARPIQKLWDPRIPGMRKSPESFLAISYVYYAFLIMTDLCYTFSPTYFLWNIQMSLRRKIPIYALTGSGILLTVVAGLDMDYSRAFLNTEDSTWALVNIFICDNVERNISGFVANLPALWFLSSNLITRSVKPSTSHGTHDYTSNYSDGTQKTTTLTSIAPAKTKDQDLNVLDDCIPLRERGGGYNSLHTLSGGGLSNDGSAGGKTETSDPPGVPCGWEDPTLEAACKGYLAELRN